MNSAQKVVLVILDGWGYRLEKKGNAIAQALTPHYSRLLGEYANGLIYTSGHHVGLPDGVMGNSEVGHMNIGSGRVIMQDQVRIGAMISDGSFFENSTLKMFAAEAKKKQKKIHLLGLVSQGNVHSSEKHYLALLDFLSREKIASDRVIVHAILDGRDTAPKSAEGYLKTLEEALGRFGGRIGSVSGRFYAMDRDQRWERTDLAYQTLAHGRGKAYESALKGLAEAYHHGETDEFVTPFVVGHPEKNKIADGDYVICFNFRADRMRQICRAFIFPDTPIPSMDKNLRANLCSFTRYDQNFGFPALLQKETYDGILGEVIENQGKTQFRTAETEKYAHVTFFFNCGREDPFEHEERRLVPSPKVKTYDLQPEMSSAQVTEGVVERIARDQHDLIVVNYAQPDMVGHTGNFDAAVSAVEATDLALGAIVEAALSKRYTTIITADHGNIEMMIDPSTGQPHTAHTLNPVPVLCVGHDLKRYRIRPKGSLCDIAPTVLHLMKSEQPIGMTGRSLLIAS